MPTDKLYADSETGCCKRFDPKPWQDREVRLKDKLFLKDSVRSFLHIPLNFGQVMKKDMDKIAAAGALVEMPLMLSDEKSLWGSDVYIAISKDVPDSEMVRLSGSFLTKVFEGSFKDTGKWVKEMQDYVASKGKKAEKFYFFYTTCPKCAKYYGKNYVVILAKIA
jgi:hypothetical protein